MDRFIDTAIRNVSTTMGINAQKLSKQEQSTIREEVERSFSYKISRDPLWERLSDDASIFDVNGWLLIKDYPYQGRVILFFDKEDEPSMYSIQNCKEAIDLIGECHGFVFYLTNSTVDFILCQNDHDFLIGAGMGKEWVENLSKAIK